MNPTARSRKSFHHLKKQGGAFAFLSVPLMLVILVLCGLALDLGQLFNRKVELHGIAKVAALAAARELNGTAGGIGNARNKAREAAEKLIYQYRVPVSWNDAAIRFGSSPSRSGEWLPASGPGDPATVFYVKADTAGLGAQTGQVSTFFMGAFSRSLGTVELADSAIAGRTAINVVPIAVCAMSTVAAAPRTHAGVAAAELVEFGFRRGVSYNLMQLNPVGPAPARFLVNPTARPGTQSVPPLDPSIIGPFVCAGTMWIPRLEGGPIRVSALPASSPLGSIHMFLNARFDQFTSAMCSPNGGPPDYNVKAYAHDLKDGTPWMKPAIGNASALSVSSATRLETIADLPQAPGGTTAESYGPLWAYAKAAKYSSSEPANGYDVFSTADWPGLYKSGPTAPGYPSGGVAPYKATMGLNYSPPRTENVEISSDQRRVLNVPLLSCPVGAGNNMQAQVLGIGRFFMTVPASSENLIAEFAGTIAPQLLTGRVELFP